MKTLNLLIDWGNSSLKYIQIDKLNVLSESNAWPVVQTVHSVVALVEQLELASHTKQQSTLTVESEYLKELSPAVALISSVRNKQDNRELCGSLKCLGFVVFIAKSQRESCGVKNAYQRPEKLGIDRWLTLLAGYSQQQVTGIIDIGSAITLDIIDRTGQHLGGQIIPGEKLLTESLLNTANIEIDSQQHEIGKFELGDSTTQCVNSGIEQVIYSYLISSISECHSRWGVENWLITGGNSQYWCNRIKISLVNKHFGVNWEPYLVFRGLVKEYLNLQTSR